MSMVYKKLAVVGEVGAGKTQFVQTISEISPFATEAKSSVDIGKQYTTVGIDYGRLMLADDIALGIYGLPGQQRFQMLWDMVRHGLWGLLVLVRFNDDAKIHVLHEILDYFFSEQKELPLVIGLTHCDEADSDEDIDLLLDSIQYTLEDHQLQAPVVPVDPRDVESSLMLLSLFDSLQNPAEDCGEKFYVV